LIRIEDNGMGFCTPAIDSYNGMLGSQSSGGEQIRCPSVRVHKLRSNRNLVLIILWAADL